MRMIGHGSRIIDNEALHTKVGTWDGPLYRVGRSPCLVFLPLLCFSSAFMTLRGPVHRYLDGNHPKMLLCGMMRFSPPSHFQHLVPYEKQSQLLLWCTAVHRCITLYAYLLGLFFDRSFFFPPGRGCVRGRWSELHLDCCTPSSSSYLSHGIVSNESVRPFHGIIIIIMAALLSLSLDFSAGQ